jgi:ubiquinone/menaquinone biosynthesis C-methylase UbiE
VDLNGLDFSPAMLGKALKRAKDAKCRASFIEEDACDMCSVPDACYDWVLATFLCCVIPRELQGQVIGEIARVLKPGGRFRSLEMVYSGKPHLRRRQDPFAPFVEKVYGARFDRDTLGHLKEAEKLRVTGTRFLRHDIYLLIEGVR